MAERHTAGALRTWLSLGGATVALLTISIQSAIATSSDRPASSPRGDGARYGQALGAAGMCYKMEATEEVARLKSRYAGGELEEFNAEAAKVLSAWHSVQTCKNAGGPNPCKLSHVWSCQEALKEIGPKGSAVPGLVRIRE